MRIGIKTGARSFRETGSGPVTNKSESASRVGTLSCQSCRQAVSSLEETITLPGQDAPSARAQMHIYIPA